MWFTQLVHFSLSAFFKLASCACWFLFLFLFFRDGLWVSSPLMLLVSWSVSCTCLCSTRFTALNIAGLITVSSCSSNQFYIRSAFCLNFSWLKSFFDLFWRDWNAPKAVKHWEKLAVLFWFWFAHGTTDCAALFIHHKVQSEFISTHSDPDHLLFWLWLILTLLVGSSMLYDLSSIIYSFYFILLYFFSSFQPLYIANIWDCLHNTGFN